MALVFRTRRPQWALRCKRMTPAPPKSRRDQAERAASALGSIPGVVAVALFGSVARGSDQAGSDVDLLALGTDERLTASALLRQLPKDLQELPVGLVYHTEDNLPKYLERWSRFAAHLRSEAVILRDDDERLQRILTADRPISTKIEVAVQRRHLANYDHLERFGGRYLFPLAKLHRIGRAAAFAVLAERGVLEFDRYRAFDALERLHPERASDLKVVERLEPFAEMVTAQGGSADLPFEPIGCTREVVDAREAVARLLNLSQHSTV